MPSDTTTAPNGEIEGERRNWLKKLLLNKSRKAQRPSPSPSTSNVPSVAVNNKVLDALPTQPALGSLFTVLNVQSVSLWDRAYDALKAEDEEGLMEEYEDLLSKELIAIDCTLLG